VPYSVQCIFLQNAKETDTFFMNTVVEIQHDLISAKCNIQN